MSTRCDVTAGIINAKGSDTVAAEAKVLHEEQILQARPQDDTVTIALFFLSKANPVT